MKVLNILKTRLHHPFLDPAELDKVIHHHMRLCQSSQEPLPVGGIASAYGQKHCRTGAKPKGGKSRWKN